MIGAVISDEVDQVESFVKKDGAEVMNPKYDQQQHDDHEHRRLALPGQEQPGPLQRPARDPAGLAAALPAGRRRRQRARSDCLAHLRLSFRAPVHAAGAADGDRARSARVRASRRRRRYVQAGGARFGQVLVVAIGFSMGPDRGISVCWRASSPRTWRGALSRRPTLAFVTKVRPVSVSGGDQAAGQVEQVQVQRGRKPCRYGSWLMVKSSWPALIADSVPGVRSNPPAGILPAGRLGQLRAEELGRARVHRERAREGRLVAEEERLLGRSLGRARRAGRDQLDLDARRRPGARPGAVVARLDVGGARGGDEDDDLAPAWQAT